MPTLLVVDDEPSILHAFRRAFREPEISLVTVGTAAEAVEAITEHQPDVVVLDVQLPDESGLEAFRRIHQMDARIPVIVITGHGTTDLAIEATKLGAYDFLLKPLELGPLRELIHRAFEINRLMHVPVVVPGDPPPTVEPSDVLVGRCPAMQSVYKAIGRVASQDVTVLILGESGTGKELVARAIYRHSRRDTGPFLAINCAAIPEPLLESEMFGHERGAFTGAERKKIGKFEQCSGGTLFLDEIGDMTPLTQTKFLRVLQEKTFERVGGNETIKTDVRILAATNRDLEQLVDAGQFRSDLYYRLGDFTIKLPPLRERIDDLPLLVEHFLTRFSRELGKDVRQAALQTMEILARYPWPGNLRELQSLLKQAILQATGPVLVPDFLPPILTAERRERVPLTAFPDWERFVAERLQGGSQELYAESLAQMERLLLTRVLEHTGGNQLQAARILGITRGSLRTKIRALGIVIKSSVATEEDEDD